MSYRGVGHVIFSIHLGVGHSVLLQLEGVGHVFSNYHILKCSGPPPPILFDQFPIATTCKRKTNVSSDHLKLTKVSCYMYLQQKQ